MMYLRKYLAWILVLTLSVFLWQSCDFQGGKGKRTTIRGTFPKFAGKQIVLSEIDVRNTTPLDTTTLSDKGDFSFRINRDSAGMYLLKLDNRNYITLVLDQENNVTVSSDADIIRSEYQVEGSEESQNLAHFEEALEENKDVVDSLILVINQGKSSTGVNSSRVQMEEEYQKAFDDQKEVSRKFIEDNCSSLASLLVLNRRFGQIKILNEQEDSRYYLMVDSCLSAKYPGNKHVLDNKKRVESILQQKAYQAQMDQKLAIGKKAPDVTLETPEGKSISLYSLAGKEVIVYFWASWDKASRQTNKEMKRVYDMYRPEGLEVYAIGLESYKDTWKGAIQADGLKWINVTDYLNVQSGTLKLFNVPKDLPYFYLLDKDLIIRYKGSSIPELLNVLKER